MTPTAAPPPSLDELLDRAESAIALAFEGEGEAWSDVLSGDRLAAVARRALEPVLEHGVVLRRRPPTRHFTSAHLGLVYLLAEQQGATHVRLRRLWDAKSARPRSPWPWISDSGLRTRCSELVAWGLVENTGARGESPTGRPATIWTLVGIHPASVGRDVAQVPGVDAGVLERLEELLVEADGDVLIRSQLELAAEVAGLRS